MSGNITVGVPSDQVPGAPAFQVSVPPTWSPAPAAGVVAAFAVAGRSDWSVVLSTMRVAADTELRDVAVRTFARQRSRYPDATIRSQRTGRFDERLTYFREVALTVGGAMQSQLHGLFTTPVGDAGQWCDVVSVVATCPDGQLEDLGPAVIDLVASFRRVDP